MDNIKISFRLQHIQVHTCFCISRAQQLTASCWFASLCCSTIDLSWASTQKRISWGKLFSVILDTLCKCMWFFVVVRSIIKYLQHTHKLFYFSWWSEETCSCRMTFIVVSWICSVRLQRPMARVLVSCRFTKFFTCCMCRHDLRCTAVLQWRCTAAYYMQPNQQTKQLGALDRR